MANRDLPVVALWVGVQTVAVLLAEATGRLVFAWLEPDAAARARWRRRVPVPGGRAPRPVAVPDPATT
jgi:hypothetical protein